MENSNTDLEFFDFSTASEDDIKEIRAILNEPGSNGCVELPWELPLNLHENSLGKYSSPSLNEESCDVAAVPTSRLCSSVESVVGQALLYTPLPQHLSAPAPHLPIPNSDVIPQVETFIPSMPPISAASALGSHYPTPYFVPRTLSYLRAYPPVGLPILTCALPGSGELTHVPSPYAPFLPIATPTSAIPHPPRLDKIVDNKDDPDVRMKVRGSSDRQYNRRNRKKNLNESNYYSSSVDYGHSSELYQDSADDQTILSPTNIACGDRLPAVPSSLPVVPVHMQPSTFPTTSGALPMHSYPPGLHPLSYSQISGPQPPTAPPLYYVPVFNPSYSGYIPSASTPVMLPVGSVGVPSSIHPASESECSATNECAEDVTRSSESLVASSSESAEKTSISSINVESDCETFSLKKSDIKNSAASPKVTNDAFSEIVHVPQKNDAIDNCSPESSDTLVDTNVPSAKSISSEEDDKTRSQNTYHDNSRCWADLFKKQQHSELNGLDRRPITIREKSSIKESNVEKDVNGKLYNVPPSDNVL